MINRQTRLTMRAFNNECEAAVANTRWNNVVAMEKRILNAAKQINNANTSMNLVIHEDYVALKLDELHLTHEFRNASRSKRTSAPNALVPNGKRRNCWRTRRQPRKKNKSLPNSSEEREIRPA